MTSLGKPGCTPQGHCHPSLSSLTGDAGQPLVLSGFSFLLCRTGLCLPALSLHTSPLAFGSKAQRKSSEAPRRITHPWVLHSLLAVVDPRLPAQILDDGSAKSHVPLQWGTLTLHDLCFQKQRGRGASQYWVLSEASPCLSGLVASAGWLPALGTGSAWDPLRSSPGLSHPTVNVFLPE